MLSFHTLTKKLEQKPSLLTLSFLLGLNGLFCFVLFCLSTQELYLLPQLRTNLMELLKIHQCLPNCHMKCRPLSPYAWEHSIHIILKSSPETHSNILVAKFFSFFFSPNSFFPLPIIINSGSKPNFKTIFFLTIR